jgi:hypothetical protein
MKNNNNAAAQLLATRKPLDSVRVSEEGVEGFDFEAEQETFKIVFGLTVTTTDGAIYRLDKETTIAADADALAEVVRRKGSIDPTLWRRIA